MRGSNTSELIFENCAVPEENILGNIGEGTAILMSGLDYERVVLAAGPLGIMAAALDIVVPYLHERKQFGKSIGEFGQIQALLADSQSEMPAGKALCLDCAKKFDEETEIPFIDIASAKLFCSEMVSRVADRAVQVMGGLGYMEDLSDVPRLFRDVRLFRIFEGASQIQQSNIAKAMLKNTRSQSATSPIKT